MTIKNTTILQIIPALQTGGAERGCVDVAAAVVAAGGRAIVVSAGGQLVTELEQAGATHITWRTAGSKNPLVILFNALRLVVLCHQQQVTLLHARSRAPAWSAYWAAKILRRPFITTFHSTYNFNSGLKRWYNSVMARGARVIAISRFIQHHILQNYAGYARAENIRLIHRGIAAEKFDPSLVTPAQLADLRTRWGVPAGYNIVLLVGRLTRWKGQTVLIDAMAQLTDLPLVAICAGGDQGRTDYTQELQAQIAKHGLQSRVKLVGDVAGAEMPAALTAATLALSCSVEPEAFGRVIVEAQAMQCPVIATNLGAVAETVQAGGFGWVVAAGDAAALADAIRAALAMPEAERAARGAAARNYVLQHYTKAKLQAATLAVYEEVLAN